MAAHDRAVRDSARRRARSTKDTGGHKQYVSDVQLAERYAVNRCTIWRWSAKGLLPTPVKLSDGCTRWRLDLIEQRDAELERKSAA